MEATKIHIANHQKEDQICKGSNIPITEYHYTVKNRNGQIMFQEKVILIGHDIPSNQMEIVKRYCQEKYLEIQKQTGRENDNKTTNGFRSV